MPIEMRVHFDKYQPRDHPIEVPTTSGCPTVLGSAKKSQWPARRGAAQRGGRGGKSDGRAAGPTGRGPGRFGEAAGIEGDARHAKKHELQRLPAAPPSLPIPWETCRRLFSHFGTSAVSEGGVSAYTARSSSA